MPGDGRLYARLARRRGCVAGSTKLSSPSRDVRTGETVTTLRNILSVLGWGGAGLLIVVFLVGLSAPHLPPNPFWWTDLFALLLPPSSVAVGGMALALGAYGLWHRRWARVLLAVGLLFLIAVRFGPRLAAWQQTASEEEGLRIMSFNVPHSSAPDAPTIDAVGRLVSRAAPDVLAVQESFLRTPQRSAEVRYASPTLQQLLADMSYTPPGSLPQGTTIQQPVLGRLSLDTLEVHSLPPSGETEARSRFTRTRFRWQGRPVVLYNLHLHTIGTTKPWEKLAEGGFHPSAWRSILRTYRDGALRRAQQARLIRRSIEREPHPVLVVGDFNSTRHQWAYRHIAQGLQNALTQRGRGWNGTFPAERPLVQIDHVLAGPEWAVTTARVPTLSGNEAASDHRPVIAQLRWEDAPPPRSFLKRGRSFRHRRPQISGARGCRPTGDPPGRWRVGCPPLR